MLSEPQQLSVSTARISVKLHIVSLMFFAAYIYNILSFAACFLYAIVFFGLQ